MSFNAIRWAFKQTHITSTEKLVLLALADIANKQGECFPSWNKIAKTACTSKTSVWRALNALEEHGLVSRENRRSANGRQRSSLYVLKLDENETVTEAHFESRSASEPSSKLKPGTFQFETRSDSGDVNPTSLQTQAKTPETPKLTEFQNDTPLTSNQLLNLPYGASADESEGENTMQDQEFDLGISTDITSPEPTAQTLVAEWLDNTEHRPPSRVIGQLSKEIKTLLEEDYDYELVREAVQTWATRGLHPGTLPSVLHQVQTGSVDAPRMRADQQRLNDGLERHKRLEALPGPSTSQIDPAQRVAAQMIAQQQQRAIGQ